MSVVIGAVAIGVVVSKSSQVSSACFEGLGVVLIDFFWDGALVCAGLMEDFGVICLASACLGGLFEARVLDSASSPSRSVIRSLVLTGEPACDGAIGRLTTVPSKSPKSSSPSSRSPAWSQRASSGSSVSNRMLLSLV